MREIIYLEQAKEDITQLNDYIANRCFAPITAFRSIEGLRDVFNGCATMQNFFLLNRNCLSQWAILFED